MHRFPLLNIPTTALLIVLVNATKAFADNNAHGRYNDPGRSYLGGKTALGHWINHLNYWGAEFNHRAPRKIKAPALTDVPGP